MSGFTMTIDGQASEAADAFEVINPATGKAFAQAPECSLEQMHAAMASAERAFGLWQRDEGKRRVALESCARAIKTHAAELARILTREQGKPLARAQEEVAESAACFSYTASLELPFEVLRDDDEARIDVRRCPQGVVAAITPWNAPLIVAAQKVAPALLAGNTIVLKPSPFTPLTTLRLGECLRDLVPPGVLNVLSGGDRLGAAMTRSPVPRKISFTGSVETGKEIAAAAAPDLKRVTLELGGNDPAVVLPDVDPKAVGKGLFWGAFANSGQVCSAIKRVYVHESQYTSIVRELAELAASVRMGDGFEPGVELGPINNRPQLDRVLDLVDDSRRAGARIETGGQQRPGPGYFYAPTVVGEIWEGTRLVDEEQFGPVLPVLRYRELGEAIERANGTRFGLSASVWSSDSDRATDVAGRLQCGTVWVNQHLDVPPFAPFGGIKWSGIGVENGLWGLLEFTEIRTLNVRRALVKRSLDDVGSPA